MEHIPIRLNTLRPNLQVLFDVYIYVAGKQIHYIKKDDVFDKDRLESLKKRGVKKLFVRQEEESAYLRYLDTCLDILSDKTTNPLQRGLVSYDTLVTDAENAERNFETENGYKSVRGRVGKIIDFLNSEQGVLKSILEQTGCALDDHQHSANVSSLATGLALKIGDISPREVGDLALAALVHDLGKSKLGFSGPIDLNKLSDQQSKEYKKHPEKALELLSSKKYVTPLILRLVSEHEELGEGKGYPERKVLSSLPITTQILSICNHFDAYSTTAGQAPTAAIQAYAVEKASLFDPDLMARLSELLSGQ